MPEATVDKRERQQPLHEIGMELERASRPRNRNADVRAATRRRGRPASALINSSESPSLKYWLSGSVFRFAKGKTATDFSPAGSSPTRVVDGTSPINSRAKRRSRADWNRWSGSFAR